MRGTLIFLLVTMAMTTACEGDGNALSDSAGGSGSLAVSATAESLTMTLDGSQVVGGSSATGSGEGEFAFDHESGLVWGAVALTGVDAAQVSLNRGYAGEQGPSVVRLERLSDTEWWLPPSFYLRASDTAAMDTGGFYVSANSPESKEILRGQVVRSKVHIDFLTLFGSQVVPAASTTATAAAALTRSTGVRADDDIVLHINIRGLADVTAVHIHEAYAGQNGPVLVELIQDPTDRSHWFTRKALFDDTALSALNGRDCASSFCAPILYVDVHTIENPGGELRAQLSTWQGDIQLLTLSGSDTVPPNGSIHTGTVATTLNSYVGWDWIPEITVYANLPGLDDASAVTFNYAPVGQNGPATYSLRRVPGRIDRWFGQILLTEPAAAGAYGWYVSVATPRLPDGELRGQWETQFNYPPDYDDSPNGNLTVLDVDPTDGSTVASWPETLQVEFNEAILADNASVDEVEVVASGGDGRFNDGNELSITPIAVTASGTTMTIELDTSVRQDDVYQLSVRKVEFSSGASLENAFFATYAVDRSHRSPRLSELQQQIFTPSCAQSGCHSPPEPAFDLDLSAGSAYASIVDVASNERTGLKIVEPGDAERSHLIGKLAPSHRRGHPVGQARLSNASIQQLRQWINEGAHDD